MSFLDKFFNKKSNSDDPILSIPQSWTVFEGVNNGMPILVRKNVGCDKIVGDSRYCTNCGIAFRILYPSENGLPNFNLEPSLNHLEDDIFGILESDLNSIVPVVITTSGFREYVVYTKDLQAFENRLARLKAKYLQYELTHFSKIDRTWETYKSFG